MIIPIKCVSCGNVIANKYRTYLERVRRRKIENSKDEDGNPNTKMHVDTVIYYSKKTDTNKETPECEVMNELGLTNMCCRRIFLTHVDIE